MIKQSTTFKLSLLLSIAFAGNICLASDDTIYSWADAVTETENRGSSVLIIPMNGQTLTDIRSEIYEDLTEDIKSLNPDLIVVEIDCSIAKDEFHAMMGWVDREELGKFAGMADNLPAVAKVFRQKLKNIEQVAFVKNSMDAITPLTLSWERIYMKPDAWLTGTMGLAQRFAGIADPNVRGKMRSAWVNLGSILGEYGNRDEDLMLALVDPAKMLSGRWDGKQVEWFDHTNGDFIVDGSAEMVPFFTATQAEELCISEATVNSLNDVLLLNDIREYHIVGEEITDSLNGYVNDWRNSYAKAKELWGDYRQQDGWATGNQRKRWLVKNKATIKSLMGICKRYPAVTIRMGFDPDLRGLENILDEIEKELRRPTGPTRGGGGPSMGGGGGGMKP